MGTDNLHHKRKERSKASLKRRRAQRDSYDVVLIVCEGSKTEPNYFRELRDDLGLNNFNVVVTGESGSDPDSVVQFAIRTAKEDGGYDRLFCVFDRDRHATYRAAIDRARNARIGIPVNTITSVPCFEYWLLLHFTYTDRAFAGTGNRSPCEEVISELHHHLRDYVKGDRGIYMQTKANMDRAINHARRALAAAEATGTDNPTTLVFELVEYLKKLREDSH
ncbi:MAG: RloB family protein [Gammaproteobacteria bacterium]